MSFTYQIVPNANSVSSYLPFAYPNYAPLPPTHLSAQPQQQHTLLDMGDQQPPSQPPLPPPSHLSATAHSLTQSIFNADKYVPSVAPLPPSVSLPPPSLPLRGSSSMRNVTSSQSTTTTTTSSSTSKSTSPSSARAKFSCPKCPSTFSRKDNLKTHQRLHSGEMPFQCQYCGRHFRWQSSARTHEQVHQRHGHKPRPDLVQKRRAAAAAKSSSRSSTSTARVTTSNARLITSSARPAAVVGQPYAQSIYRDAQSVLNHTRISTGTPILPPIPIGNSVPSPVDLGLLGNTGTSATLPLISATVSRRSKRHALPPAIRKSRHSTPLLLELRGEPDMMADCEVGAALAAQPSTPQHAQGDSPMFSLPKMSQQELENCFDQHAAPDPSGN